MKKIKGNNVDGNAFKAKYDDTLFDNVKRGGSTKIPVKFKYTSEDGDVNSKTVVNFTVSILDDPYIDNTIIGDIFGNFALFHKRYDFVKSFGFKKSQFDEDDVDLILSPEDSEDKNDLLDRDEIIIPVFMYEHSGISLSVSNSYPFNDRFDSCVLGIVHENIHNIKSEFKMADDVTKEEVKEKFFEYIKNVISSMNSILSGDVYAYSVELYGEMIDSCCGFIGISSAYESLVDIFEHTVKNIMNKMSKVFEERW